MSNKQAIILIVVLLILFGGFYTMCSPKETILSSSNLPVGITIDNFKEVYNSMNGQQKVAFTLTNKTGKKIDYPEVEASYYLHGSVAGTATGGCKEPLNDKESCNCDVLWIMPDSNADSIVFRFIGNR